MDAAIRASLDLFTDSLVLPDDALPGRLIREFGRAGRRAEENRVDLKESFDNSPKAWPSICKDIVAFHNSAGGVLIFGIADDGRRVGLPESLSSSFDLSNVARKMNRYHLSGQVATSYVEKSYRSKLYGFLFVYPGGNLLVFDSDLQVESGQGKTQTLARGGVVYVRNSSSSEPARQQALDAKVSQLVGRGVRAFLARVQSVAELPSNTNLIAQTPGSGSGYLLTSAGHGIPVRVALPDESAEAIPLAENLSPDLPLGGVSAEVIGQFRQFRADPNTRVSAATLDRWYLLRSSLDLPRRSGVVQFLTQSALENRGRFCYWASLMSRDELREFVIAQRALHKYPTRDVLPWLIAALLWEEKEELLDEALMRPQAVRKIREASSQEDILTRGRIGALAVNIKIGEGSYVNLPELFSDRDAAQQLYVDLLSRELEPGMANQLSHQLDLWLHARRPAEQAREMSVEKLE